jgi:hypothetical protein
LAEIIPGLRLTLILSERDESLKAVVVQIVGRHAVLLTENGMFLKVKNQRYRTGQQISFCPKRRSLVKPLAMAASLIIFLLGGTFLALERLPFSYVSIDVNPSIEYTLNWFDRVLSLRAVNEDAKPIAQNLQEKGALNQPIAIAVGMTIKSLNEMLYFKDDAKNDVVIAVASFGLKNVDSLSGTLKDSAGSSLTDHVLAVTSFQTDTAKVHEAQKYHTTAGKLIIVENLAQGGDGYADATKEEWLKKPVREILGHNNGKAQTQADEKKPENTEHMADGMGTEGIPPKKTVSPQPRSTEKADAPKETDTPKGKHDQPNTEKVKQTDATPTVNVQDKPQNTPAPKDKEQGPKTGTPGKGLSGGQEKENGTQEGAKEPSQPSDGGGPKKDKP